MNYNLHTHTVLCGHATGSAQEYIERAVACGITELGFSDHLPFRFPDGYESFYRIPTAEVNSYKNALSALREAYKDRIKIHIGFEMECYPKYFDEMLQNARNYGAEYLILGQHFLGSEHPDGQSATTMTRDPAQLTEYVDCVVRGIESGVFTYVAHPDMINFAGEETIYINEMQRICDASVACNVPLEINLLGIRGSRRYPRKLFWELAGKTQVPVTIGSDAHDPQNVYDPDSLAVAKQWIAEFNLNYIGKAPLINPDKKSR